MNLADLAARNLISPPPWLPQQPVYLTVMGSHAYGMATEASDTDVYGFVVPPRELLFPKEIPGFGTGQPRFNQWQQTAVQIDGKEHDFQVFNIVKYAQLCMENNPNMLDSLFTPDECVLQSSPASDLLRRNRRVFLHKGCKFKFMGYAMSQMHKIGLKTPETGSRRAESIAQHGYDVKYAVHLVRLVKQCEQLLTEGDMDIRRHAGFLREIRGGLWTEQQLRDWFAAEDAKMTRLYGECECLPHGPNEPAIRDLLLECIGGW